MSLSKFRSPTLLEKQEAEAEKLREEEEKKDLKVEKIIKRKSQKN